MPIVGTLEEGTYDKYDPRAPAIYIGESRENDGQTVIYTDDVSHYNTFLLKSSVGAMDVFVDLGDGNFIGPYSMADLGATSNDPVIVTAALQMYGWRGVFRFIQVRQKGATGVVGAVMRLQSHI